MAFEPLSDELKEAGLAMTRELDAISLRPQGALWLHFHHVQDWRFTVVSDLVDHLGRRKVYGLLDQALAKHPPIDGLTIFDVHLASVSEVMPRVIGAGFRVAGLQRVEISHGLINDMLVDAFIYRLTEGRDSAEIKKAARIFEKGAVKEAAYPPHHQQPH